MSDETVLKNLQPVKLTADQIKAKNIKNEAILEAALPIALEEQKDSRFFDLDKSYREYKQEQVPFKIKLCNRYFEIPRTMPASYFTMLIATSEKNGTRDLTQWKTADLMPIMQSVLPKEAYDLIMENKIPLNFIIKSVLPKIIQLWQGEVDEQIKNEQEETRTDG